MDNEESLFDIEQIRTLVRQGDVVWRDHAIKRLRERKISREDVRNAIFNGEIIEDRPDDVPVPCCLVLGADVKGIYLHVICGMIDGIVFIISAYYPDPERWEADLMTRKG